MLNEYIVTLKNMTEETISQEFRLKNIDDTRKLFHWRNKSKLIDE